MVEIFQECPRCQQWSRNICSLCKMWADPLGGWVPPSVAVEYALRYDSSIDDYGEIYDLVQHIVSSYRSCSTK